MWFLGSCSFHAPESTYAGQAITKSLSPMSSRRPSGGSQSPAHWGQGAGVSNESPAHWGQGASVWDEPPAHRAWPGSKCLERFSTHSSWAGRLCGARKAVGSHARAGARLTR